MLDVWFWKYLTVLAIPSPSDQCLPNDGGTLVVLLWKCLTLLVMPSPSDQCHLDGDGTFDFWFWKYLTLLLFMVLQLNLMN